MRFYGLTADPSFPNYCPICGIENENLEDYCKSCGHGLSYDISLFNIIIGGIIVLATGAFLIFIFPNFSIF